MSEPIDTDFKRGEFSLNLTLNPGQLEDIVDAIKSLNPVSSDILPMPDTMVVDDKEVTADEVRRLRTTAKDYDILVRILDRRNRGWCDGEPVHGNPYMGIVDELCRIKREKEKKKESDE